MKELESASSTLQNILHER